jgi:hypothetical protein
MRSVVSASVCLILLLSLSGCTERQRQDWSHWKSDLVGLKRTVTLYADNGTPIKSWKGRFKVDVGGGTARFLHEGRAVIISGTFIIEESK